MHPEDSALQLRFSKSASNTTGPAESAMLLGQALDNLRHDKMLHINETYANLLYRSMVPTL